MFLTQILSVAPDKPDPSVIKVAARVLRSGGLVAFPTETVYGLGAEAMNPDAVQKVFEAKGRPADNPLIVHIAERHQLEDYVQEIPAIAATLIDRFWPGPLTLVMKSTELVPENVTAGLETVAVRMPNHAVALALIRELGDGIVGPSANRSGKPSPTLASHVADDLSGRVDMILDAGSTRIGVESTVLDVMVSPPAILRRGGVTKEELESCIGTVHGTPKGELLKRSPGTRHRHYAPNGTVALIAQGDLASLNSVIQEAAQRGKKVGAIIHTDLALTGSVASVIHLSSDLHFFARELFSALRTMDDHHVDLIVVEGVPEVGIGAAIMDRLRRASQS